MAYSVEEKLKWARIKLLMDNNFFGALLLKFPMIEWSSEKNPTMCTNGSEIMWNRKFIEEMTKEETLGVVTHELLHNYFKHFIRFNLTTEKYAFITNMAMDYAINSLITNDMKLILPKDTLYNSKYIGMNAEKILTELLKDPDIKNMMKAHDELRKLGKAVDGIGNKMANQSHSASANATKQNVKKKGGKKQVADDINNKIFETWSGLSQKEKGNMAGAFKREIDDIEALKKGKINWKKFILNRIMDVGRTQYDSRKFNKKYLSGGWFFAGMTGSKAKISLALDTSGSISEKEIIDFLKEIKALVSRFPNIEILMYGCDSEIHGKAMIKGKRQFKSKNLKDMLKGGGGTSHLPIFKDIVTNKEKVKMLFCFTDGYSDINSIPKSLWGKIGRIYWVLPEESKEMKFNFGQKIIIENETNYDY